jgi:radical SAM-linked protein
MKLEVVFCKKGAMRYISHLDIVRLLQRAIRRASLPVVLSQGFTPHYKIGFSNALKLGVESEGENAVFAIDGWIDQEEFKNRINEKLPEGIKVLECKKRF